MRSLGSGACAVENLGLIESSMRIFLTGATGFIGRHVIRSLGTEHKIIALTQHVPEGKVPPHIHFVEGNLLREGEARRLAARFPADLVLHLAWHVPPGEFWNSPQNLDWLAASLLLARAFAEKGTPRVIYAGSGAEYDWNANMPLKEDESPVKPRSLYGVCKNGLRQVLEAYTVSVGVSCLWCRIFWPYGRGEAPKKFLSDMMRAFRAGQPAVCHGANLERDYIHVEDIGHALALAATSTLTGVLNIGSGEAVSLGDMARMAAEAAGRPDLLDLEQVRISEETPKRVVASVERLRGELGWTPRRSLSDGITAMLEQTAEKDI